MIVVRERANEAERIGSGLLCGKDVLSLASLLSTVPAAATLRGAPLESVVQSTCATSVNSAWLNNTTNRNTHSLSRKAPPISDASGA